MGAYHNALREEGSRAELIRELEKCWAILDIIDKRAPRADRTCAQPGITLSEAARRLLRDEGHPLFQEGGRVMDTLFFKREGA